MLPEPSECFVYAKPCKREHETACMMISIAHYQEAFNQLRQVGAERDDLRKRLQARIASLEAERDKAVELLRELQKYLDERYDEGWPHCSVRKNCSCLQCRFHKTLASIGGEVKHG